MGWIARNIVAAGSLRAAASRAGLGRGLTGVFACVAGLAAVACSSVPTGAGVYLVTIADATSGKPVEGVEIAASGAGIRSRGGKPSTAKTDEDGEATLAFGSWGSVDLMLEAGAASERWLVVQDRVAVNGGKSSKDPLRMIVGSGEHGGLSRFKVAITRVERGPRIDN